MQMVSREQVPAHRQAHITGPLEVMLSEAVQAAITFCRGVGLADP